MNRWVVMVACAGCSFDHGELPHDAGGPPRDGPDLDIGDAGSCVGWDALDVMPCDPLLGSPEDIALPAGTYTFDADTGMLTGSLAGTLAGALVAQPSGPMVRAVNASRLSIESGATLTVVGSHPVVFVVHGDASIAGTVDASARPDGSGNTVPGPGGDDADACAGGIGIAGTDATGVGGAGGGGGGGFGGDGGDGGDGAGNGHGAHGAHGAATGMPTLEPLRGGCGGGTGGATLGADNASRAGNGGGAVEITARGEIDVTGTLLAAGTGGGTPRMVNGGGGGGGGGGGLLLDGDIVRVESSGRLCANGGGGGEGGAVAQTSAPGRLGTCSATAGAQGGSAVSGGGDGGDGGYANNVTGGTGATGGSSGGGGGGGGAAGRIRARGRTMRTIDGAATVSPVAGS